MRAFCNERTLSLLSPRVGSLPAIAEVGAAAAETVATGAGAGAVDPSRHSEESSRAGVKARADGQR